MTATEASRGFKELLDAVERGETVVLTRAGRRIATVVPAARGNGRDLGSLFGGGRFDAGYQGDVADALSILLDDEPGSWPDA